MIQTLKKILAPIAVSLETKAVWIREDKIESLRSDYIALASRLSIWREGTNSQENLGLEKILNGQKLGATMKQVESPPPLAKGLYFEGPRWHHARLWMVDSLARTLLSVGLDGDCRIEWGLWSN